MEDFIGIAIVVAGFFVLAWGFVWLLHLLFITLPGAA
jgi:hypothetical protein